jgi:hypothetical protein
MPAIIPGTTLYIGAKPEEENRRESAEIRPRNKVRIGPLRVDGPRIP